MVYQPDFCNTSARTRANSCETYALSTCSSTATERAFRFACRNYSNARARVLGRGAAPVK
eukprot:2360868-Pyramimonas_sp.AAC.1